MTAVATSEYEPSVSILSLMVLTFSAISFSIDLMEVLLLSHLGFITFSSLISSLLSPALSAILRISASFSFLLRSSSCLMMESIFIAADLIRSTVSLTVDLNSSNGVFHSFSKDILLSLRAFAALLSRALSCLHLAMSSVL